MNSITDKAALHEFTRPKLWKTLVLFLLIEVWFIIIVYPTCLLEMERWQAHYLGVLFSDSFIGEMLTRSGSTSSCKSAASSMTMAKGTVLVIFAAYVVHLLRSILHELKRLNDK